MTEGLPRFGQPLPEGKAHWDLSPSIDWFWVKVGIKSSGRRYRDNAADVDSSSRAECTSAYGLNPDHVLTRPFVRAGGTGDQGIFQNSFFGSLVLIGCIIVLLLITPFLANYLVMNLTLFVILFGLGFLTARMAGINFWILLAYLSISVFVGLNPQQPVDSQTIIDSFIGLMVGMFIGALVSRIDLAGFAPRTAPRQSTGSFRSHQSAATGRSASGKS